jgi:hypothetical protein
MMFNRRLNPDGSPSPSPEPSSATTAAKRGKSEAESSMAHGSSTGQDESEADEGMVLFLEFYAGTYGRWQMSRSLN